MLFPPEVKDLPSIYDTLESFITKTILIVGGAYTIWKGGKKTIGSIRATWRKLSAIGDSLDAQAKILMTINYLEAQNRIAFEASNTPQWKADAKGTLTSANSALSALTGYSEHELYGIGWRTFIHNDDEETTVNEWNSAVMTSSPFNSVFRMERKSGEVLRVRMRAFPVGTLSGMGYSVMVQELSDFKGKIRTLKTS